MTEQSAGGDRFLAVLAYLGPMVVIPLLVRNKKRFLGYHTRQGLYLFAISIAVFLLTLGLLFLFQRGVPLPGVFLFLSVLLLLEVVAYGLTTLYLAYHSARGSMPMLPVLGEMAGEV